jgi:hypothetical protein
MATFNSFRKAVGAIKDSTTVSIAKVNSEFKDLDVAIVKATNHVESAPKERHIRSKFLNLFPQTLEFGYDLYESFYHSIQEYSRRHR